MLVEELVKCTDITCEWIGQENECHPSEYGLICPKCGRILEEK